MTKIIISIALFLFCCSNLTTAQSPQQVLSTPLDSLYQGLKFRNIGPFRGGRSVASCGVISDPLTYYMGSTGGGIWKTTDAGIKWTNISDGQLNTGSVGAIEVAPSDPNVIYVGMGEHPVRGVMTSHGDGMYKSEDAGKTWTHKGLPMSRHIAEIKIHPSNPDVVYVAVQGAVHGDSEDRGVYKTVDGGESWDKVLYVDQTTGAADLTMDPSNPRILFASMWDHRRYPWQVRSGGEGSAIYKSTDGGASWEKVSGGLPAKMGKSAIDISPANTQVVYANIEAEGEKGGVYKSTDGGTSWKQTTKDRVTVARAWYYIEIFADPNDEHTVYVLNAPVLKSIDGGKTFKSVPNPHGDQHHMWINPDNSKNIVLSNDGGACVTFNGGVSWSSQENQPTIQFYRVITDNLFPYNVYGGQQDNSSIVTASRTSGRGVSWKDWFNGPGCESAFLAFDPDDPQLIYGGCYQGNISVMDRTTKEEVDIMAYPTVGLGWTPSEMKYRFNWNAPIVASPQDPNTIYHCGNHVLVTRNKGVTWEELSPDLTRNDKSKQAAGGAPYTNEGAGGEVYNTISYLEASTHSNQVLWAGSDCGLVHVTQDGGASWSNVTPPGIGEALINSIDVSPHDPATAYIAVTKYKFNDFTPLIYKTNDFGKSWKKITAGIGKEHYVRVVREDYQTPGLLYAGTEVGLYLSYDHGAKWERLQLNLPTCPITDLTFQDNDLIVATSGRSFWILDDLTSLQHGMNIGSASIKLFTPKDSYRISSGGRGSGQPKGQNPPSGISFDYYIPKSYDKETELSLEVLDKQGTVLRKYSSQKDKSFKKYDGGPQAPKTLPIKPGLNRFTWDMRKTSIAGVHGVFLIGGYNGPLVPPGEYTLRLTSDQDIHSVTAVLKADPRIDVTDEAYQRQYSSILEVESMAKNIQNDVNKMRKVKNNITAINKMLDSGVQSESEVKEYSDSLITAITLWEEQLIQPDQKTFQDVINFPNRMNAEASDLMSRMGGMIPTITDGMAQRLSDLKKEYTEIQAQKDKLMDKGVMKFNQMIKDAEIDLINLPEE